MKRYTPDHITKLEPHQIVIFGSNIEGRHGKGFALTCKQRFGAINGQARYLQGQSYGIVTIDLYKGKRSIPFSHIQDQIIKLYKFAEENPDREILMTKIGTQLAGYTEDELEQILINIEHLRPENVLLPRFKNDEI